MTRSWLRDKLTGRILTSLLMITMFVAPAAAQAQDRARTERPQENYRLGPGDVLQLNVLEDPSLDLQRAIQQDGTVFIPQVGEVEVDGLTLTEAEDLVRSRLQVFNPRINKVTLQVAQYNSLRVYVLGAVVRPGEYTFTSTPTAWDAVRAAGGPHETANLGSVRIITRTETRAQTRTVNLSGLLTGGEVPEVILRSGDTMIVPNIGDAGLLTAAAPAGVEIVGAVGTPTVIPLDGPTRLLSCLMQAGAPTANAAYDKIWWVHHDGGDRYTARRVDLNWYFQRGSLAGNPLIYPGDALHLEHRRESWMRRNLPLFLGVLSSVATIYLVYDRIQDD
ncbi:MAG: polysaccharide biosynthesis/export family protein [Candidatus Krumholzibacteriia bacterium]